MTGTVHTHTHNKIITITSASPIKVVASFGSKICGNEPPFISLPIPRRQNQHHFSRKVTVDPHTHTQTSRHTAVQWETIAMHSQIEGKDEDSTQARRPPSLSVHTESLCVSSTGRNK